MIMSAVFLNSVLNQCGEETMSLSQVKQSKAGRPATKRRTKASKTAGQHQNSTKANHVLQVKNDAEAFLPRREIPRTPPRVTRESHSSKLQQQRSTPRRDAVRRATPSADLKMKTKDGGPSEISTVAPSCSISEENSENIPPGDREASPCDRKVQAPCFTPRRSLARSPPRTGVDAPPPPRWELPRTPVTIIPTTTSSPPHVVASHRLKPTHNKSGSTRIQYGTTPPQPVAAPKKNTSQPTTASPPPASSPLAAKNHSLTERKRLTRDHCSPEACHHTQNDPQTDPLPQVVAGAVNISSSSLRTQLATKSPPISIHKGSEVTVSLPEDLVCNDSDLAFLEHMKNVQQHDQLQTQLARLDKDLRATTEQREQLHHNAEKVSSDLEEMKHKYKTTLSSVRALHSTVEPPAGPNSAHSTSASADIIDGDLLPNELSHTHLSQLRHMQQLMNVQCEKTDREIKKKVVKINCDKHELQDQMRMRVQELAQLNEDRQMTQTEKCAWEERVKQASEDHHKMESELESLHSQLSQLELTASQDSNPLNDHSEDSAVAERKRAEGRLHRLIGRCELYVKRHQLLKQLRHQQNSI